MNKVYIGKVITTHGIKGEIRIKSDFKYKNKVFVVGKKLIIDNIEYIIKSYRVHKNYDMVTLNDYDNINDVLKLLKLNVYVDRNSINNVEYLDEDLIGMDVIFNNKNVGKIIDIENIKNNPLLVIENNNEKKFVPNNKEFIENVDLSENKVYIKYVEGLL